jgi:hypothetical protein
LVAYLADFGLTLAELKPHQVAMFVAARNLASEIEGLELPVASTGAEGDEDLVAQSEDASELTSYQRDLADADLPADEMDVAPIRATEDLARIFPTQWMMEEIWPEAFYAKLAERELLMPQWRQASTGPRDDSGNSPDWDLVDKQSAADTVREHAYVLLDTSHSMNARDRRGIVARGLALAFLHKGHENRCRLHLRPFTAQVGELSTGQTDDEFHAIARRIIDLPHAGQTRIQAALEHAVRDIRSGGECRQADILLITDGMSRLTQNPLADERLHTFLVGDLLEDRESAGPVSTLKSWSRTFRRIWQGGFEQIVSPTVHDCLAVGQVVESLLDDPNSADPSAQSAALDHVLANLRAMLADLKRSLGKGASLPPEAQGIERQLQEGEQAAAQARAHASNSQPTSAVQKAMSSAAGNSGNGGFGLVKFNPWESIKRLARWIWRLLARRSR